MTECHNMLELVNFCKTCNACYAGEMGPRKNKLTNKQKKRKVLHIVRIPDIVYHYAIGGIYIA